MAPTLTRGFSLLEPESGDDLRCARKERDDPHAEWAYAPTATPVPVICLSRMRPAAARDISDSEALRRPTPGIEQPPSERLASVATCPI
jgi:hypothetical protein